MKAGMEFTTRRKSARCIGCFEHEHVPTALCQVGRADQSVVSRANDDRVVPIQSRTPSVLIIDSNLTLVTACRQGFRAYTLRTHPLPNCLFKQYVKSTEAGSSQHIIA